MNENVLRKKKDVKLAKLNDYHSNYSSDKFILDLEDYFGKDVDFNFNKIKQVIEVPGKLEEYVDRAKEKNTHPVIEFVQNIFKELTSEGKNKN